MVFCSKATATFVYKAEREVSFMTIPSLILDYIKNARNKQHCYFGRILAVHVHHILHAHLKQLQQSQNSLQ